MNIKDSCILNKSLFFELVNYLLDPEERYTEYNDCSYAKK